MSSENKFIDKITEVTTENEQTRRDFLKFAGKGAAGIMVSSAVLNLVGCDNDALENPNATGTPTSGAVGFALATGLLVQNYNRCLGCRRCEINCSLLWGQEACHPHVSGIKVWRNYQWGAGGPAINYNVMSEPGLWGNQHVVAETCKQCRDPFCARACPVGAISADASMGGARTVDTSKCVGCGLCESACPWGMITVSKDSRKSFKCKSCGYCATWCPTGALKIIPWEDVKNAMNAHPAGFDCAPVL